MELQAKGVSRRFFRKSGDANYFYAVRETDLLLKSSELTVLLGRSGSGKTTLLNLLAGLLTPSGGQVLLGDTDLYALGDKALSRFRNAHIGVIPQGQSALFSLTALENVLLPARLYGADAQAEARARALLERFDIGGLADALPAELSGGELRRVCIARALINHPDVVLADEPTGDLDDQNTALVLQALQDVAREGAAVLLVTHETDAVRYADRVLRMNAGTLEAAQQTPKAAPIRRGS